jgi:hypothetical protein
MAPHASEAQLHPSRPECLPWDTLGAGAGGLRWRTSLPELASTTSSLRSRRVPPGCCTTARVLPRMRVTHVAVPGCITRFDATLKLLVPPIECVCTGVRCVQGAHWQACVANTSVRCKYKCAFYDQGWLCARCILASAPQVCVVPQVCAVCQLCGHSASYLPVEREHMRLRRAPKLP